MTYPFSTATSSSLAGSKLHSLHLHTVQCTLRTAPAPTNSPASAPVHSYYTLNTAHHILILMLHIYHFTL